jgi:outer membrane protein TolC
MGPAPRILGGAALLALVVLPACRRFTKEGADREVYGILGAKRPCVPEVAGTLDVEAREGPAEALRRSGRLSLGLREALALATTSSREYRGEREDVYLAALDLTRARTKFRPLFSAGASAEVEANPGQATAGATPVASVSRGLENGGTLLLSLVTDVLRNLTGDPIRVAQTILSSELVFPLARGSGRLVAREDLTQSERNTLYALRAYARFQQRFTVDVATRFYLVLQDRDTWQNEEATYKSLLALRDRQEAMGAQGAGRIPDFQVDQARQDVLRSDDRRQRARFAYESSLDAFKQLLGIPVTTEVELRDDDLVALRDAGPRPAPFELAQALATAFRRRLDLATARDQEEDARRKAEVARDGLGPQVDLRLGGALTGPATKPLDLGSADPSLTLGLDVDLPLERTTERNAFRTALVQALRARRARQGVEDQVALEVREAFRELDQAQRTWGIQKEAVRLAERRVDMTGDLLQRGDATTRDRLEAEDDLIGARNTLTRAVVDHAVAHLVLERDVGTLRVDAEGWWRPTAPPPPPPPPPPPEPPPEGTAAGAESSSLPASGAGAGPARPR